MSDNLQLTEFDISERDDLREANRVSYGNRICTEAAGCSNLLRPSDSANIRVFKDLRSPQDVVNPQFSGETQSRTKMYETSSLPKISTTRAEYMLGLETKINTEIGYRFWKKYVNAAFWSYISLPINLSITMMTALSTGQATTDNLLPKPLYINISLATLVISVLNTYFRPYVQMNQNIEYMNKWSVLGCQFEEIYYSENQSVEHINSRIIRYEGLLKNINDLKKAEILETQNFLTDSIHLALRSCYCCLKNKNRWLALDETLKAEEDEAKRLADIENPDDSVRATEPDKRTLTDVGITTPDIEQLYLYTPEKGDELQRPP